MWERPPLVQLEESIGNPCNPIGMRMRAAYYLRQGYDEIEKNEIEDVVMKNKLQQDIINILSNGLLNVRHGSLMRHEIAYVMGQIRDDRCCTTLETILSNNEDCVMVRHEAAEALAAIGSIRSIPIIQTVIDQNTIQEEELTVLLPELTETCRVALDVMEWRMNGSNMKEMPPMACACMISPYSSIDPAPPNPDHVSMTCQELGNILKDTNVPIFERYRAMFSLRNIGTVDAVQELCTTLMNDTSSTLLRHEIAYVLGQLQHPISIEALETSLRNINEHTMVRHESAEALGAIDDKWDIVEKILLEFTNDLDDVVRESCLVALDAADYWGYNTTNTTNNINNNNSLDDDNNNYNQTNIHNNSNDGKIAENGKEGNNNNNIDNHLSFAHQKAGVGSGDHRKEVLLNHFNIKQ